MAESSAWYRERGDADVQLAADADLPRNRIKHEESARRWYELAERHERIETGNLRGKA